LTGRFAGRGSNPTLLTGLVEVQFLDNSGTPDITPRKWLKFSELYQIL
jgi:hypothetical protein